MPRTLTPAKQRAQYALNGEAERLQFDEQATAPCRTDPAAFVDWEDPDEPAVFQAQVSCIGCEFIVNCRARARLERPDHGVWAAEVWEGGRIVRRSRRAEREAYDEAVGHLG